MRTCISNYCYLKCYLIGVPVFPNPFNLTVVIRKVSLSRQNTNVLSMKGAPKNRSDFQWYGYLGKHWTSIILQQKHQYFLTFTTTFIWICNFFKTQNFQNVIFIAHHHQHRWELTLKTDPFLKQVLAWRCSLDKNIARIAKALKSSTIHHPPCQTSWRENATLNQTSPWLSRKPPNQTILSTSAPSQGQTSSRRAPWGSFITYIVSNRD